MFSTLAIVSLTIRLSLLSLAALALRIRGLRVIYSRVTIEVPVRPSCTSVPIERTDRVSTRPRDVGE